MFLYTNSPPARASAQSRGSGPEPKPHPSGKACDTAVHVVLPGESLWAIAAAHLSSDDPALIADLWPRIYERNRAAIGPDPDLLFPGERLVLPSVCP